MKTISLVDMAFEPRVSSAHRSLIGLPRDRQRRKELVGAGSELPTSCSQSSVAELLTLRF